MFPYTIEIRPPEDENRLASWKAQLEEDIKTIQSQDNKNNIAEDQQQMVLSNNNIPEWEATYIVKEVDTNYS